MGSVAAILDFTVLYRHSLILALACGAGICIFMACCCHADISPLQASAAVLLAMLLSYPMGRLLYWYGRPDSFSSFFQVMTVADTEAFALAGILMGCALSVTVVGGRKRRKIMLDCMSVACCAGIALGRLGCFFTEANRGQVMTQFTGLPWAYPVINASGAPEYRFATFLFQAAAAAVLGILLTVIFFRKKQQPGKVTFLFLLFYCTSQILLDSTRYDALFLRNNGFIHLVQVLCAVTLVIVFLLLSVRTVKLRGFKVWMIPLWLGLVALLGSTGYMEYYVQRHGRHAFFAYSIMGCLLVCIAALGLVLLELSAPSEKRKTDLPIAS